MKRYFYRLPSEVMEEHGPIVAAVYAVLLDACQEGVFRADLKVETIAKKCGITDRTVRTAIHKLVELGLVRRAKDGRRTVYDIVPILPPKERNKSYVPETYQLLGDTYRDLLRRIPDQTSRRHYQNMLERLGYPLDEEALFDLRTISVQAEDKRKQLPEEFYQTEDNPEDSTEQERIFATGSMTKFTDYDEDEQAEFAGQLAFDV